MTRDAWYVRSSQMRPHQIGRLAGHAKEALLTRGHRRQIDQFRYVVIVTYGRSGSTVLQAALNAQPGVAIRGENMAAAQGLFATYRSVRAMREENAGKGLMLSQPSDPWYGAQLVDDAFVLKRLQDLFLNGILAPPRGTKVTGFKEVRHTSAEFRDYDEFRAYLEFLSTLLPGAAFLLNIRDVADTIKSGWWSEQADATTIVSTARSWLEQFASDAPSLGITAPLLDYSTWCGQPDVLSEVFRSIHLEVDEAALARAVTTRLTHLHGS